MSKHKGFVKFMSLTAALSITVCAVSGSMNTVPADAYYDGSYDYYNYGANGYDSGYDNGAYGYDQYSGYGYDYGTYGYDTYTGYDNTTGYTGYDNTTGYNNTTGYDTNSTAGYDYTTGTTDSTAADNTSSQASSDDSEAEQAAITENTEITGAARSLKTLIGRKTELNVEISDAKTALKEEEKMLKSLRKRADEIDKELYILNRSMATMEIKVNANKHELDRINNEIEDGTDKLKKRMRALYLSGSDSYTTMILESDSFYDVLMRMELIKRVAEHDDNVIDELYGLKDQFEAKQAKLSAQQEELDKQYELFDGKKAKLDELYNSSTQARKLLEEKQQKLKEQAAQLNVEKIKSAQALSQVLNPYSGMVPFEEEIAANCAAADERLNEIHNEIREREKDGDKLTDDEPRYEFAWPVPDSFDITSGVGARWGTYHTGLDIAYIHGTPIHATETGTVIMTNETCTHDYGKTASCGCGGGYGNFVIIDHGNDFLSLYGHMTKVLVKPGDRVTQGEVIGLMGSTGYSTGEHLHFELRYQGNILDPALYVDASISGSNPRKSQKSDAEQIEVVAHDNNAEKQKEVEKKKEEARNSAQSQAESEAPQQTQQPQQTQPPQQNSQPEQNGQQDLIQITDPNTETAGQ
ncbi:MAG: peptidoglycan DD-metalloendopeptidase family protein [Ruminococcus sp.]|nr:peptidoglycan DD-metalloendopeptidase family protein [Ruminococcus sp.]